MTTPNVFAGSDGIGVDEAIYPAGPNLSKISWLTPRRITLFLTVWMVAFALGGIAISNPFATEPSASSTPNYWHVMYLHGLLICMVGLAALLVLEVFKLPSLHARVGVALGVLAATVLASMGGIWDTKVPGAEVAMWTQIVGFFALDEILILLVWGFSQGWRAHEPSSRSLPFVGAWLASASMFIAAVMGHLAGWIFEFGNHPWFIGSYASFVGEKLDDFRDNLVGSHSHEMAVATMALLAVTAAQKFGYRDVRSAARRVSRLGLAMIAIGIVAMTAMYVAMATTSWAAPTYFKSAGGANGIASDDILTGVLIMGGGLLALWPLVVAGVHRAHSWLASLLPVAAAWAWTGIVLGVVIAGYWIELHETFFGAGDPTAAGATNDAVFTWLHQDIGLFLFPALAAILLLSDHLAARHHQRLLAWGALLGTTVLLIGGGIWVFSNPDLHGPGYVVSTAGLVLVGISVVGAAVSGIRGDPGFGLVPHVHHRGHWTAPLHRAA